MQGKDPKVDSIFTQTDVIAQGCERGPSCSALDNMLAMFIAMPRLSLLRPRGIRLEARLRK